MAKKKPAASEAVTSRPAIAGPIMVAVDFSNDSRAALAWANDLALALEHRLLVLHVVHDPLDAPGYYKQPEGDQIRPMEEIAKKMMDDFLHQTLGYGNEQDPPPHLDTELVIGVPVTRILEVADKSGASMIVMGSQGRTGLEHLLLGSKAEQVVHLSPVPITIIKTPKSSDDN